MENVMVKHHFYFVENNFFVYLLFINLWFVELKILYCVVFEILYVGFDTIQAFFFLNMKLVQKLFNNITTNCVCTYTTVFKTVSLKKTF